MRFFERSHDERAMSPTPSLPSGGDDAFARAERLLAAADDAVAGALSRDSRAFLDAIPQESGQ